MNKRDVEKLLHVHFEREVEMARSDQAIRDGAPVRGEAPVRDPAADRGEAPVRDPAADRGEAPVRDRPAVGFGEPRTPGHPRRQVRSRGSGWLLVAAAAAVIAVLPALMIVGKPTLAPLALRIDRAWDAGAREKVQEALVAANGVLALKNQNLEDVQ